MSESIKKEKVLLSEIKFNQAIYPRKEHNISKVQEYTNNIEQIEAVGNFIHISNRRTLLDGRHRHLAYRKKYEGKEDSTEIFVYIHEIDNDADEYKKAIELNSSHGQQLSHEDKKQNVINLYSKYGVPLEEIAKLASVRKSLALEWTKSIREQEEAEVNEKIFNMWLACYTQDEIAEVIGITQQRVEQKTKELQIKFPGTKFVKLPTFEDFNEQDGLRPIYNVWTFSKKTNTQSHFGNSEQRITENLLYLYTEPYEVVVDPFAGGGATIDVCKKRLRRYWCSDRKPAVEREGEIRSLDAITEQIPLGKRWSDVSLTFLDPPYWKQAYEKYSKDKEDLANMSLEDFTKSIVDLINTISKKQSKGVIALLIQPTQWNAPNHEWTDHVMEILFCVQKNKRLQLENRVSCPYSTQQCLPQMVNYAKEHKSLLCLTRELIIWRVLT